MENFNNPSRFIPQSSNLFSDRINTFAQEKNQIDETIKTSSLTLTDSEKEIQDYIISQLINIFSPGIKDKGFTAEIKNDVKTAVRAVLDGQSINNKGQVIQDINKLDGYEINLQKPFCLSFEYLNLLRDDYSMKARIEKSVNATIGLGPLEELIADETITEIVVQRYDNILVERRGKVVKTPYVFSREEDLVAVIGKIVQQVGRTINISTPLVDARLKDGSRINATIPPVTPDGATLTIRKFSDKAFTEVDYINFGSISQKMIDFLKLAVQGKCNIFISGGTGTGKTTFLNMLSNFIPKDELIVTIEDVLELKIQSPNVRKMETRKGSFDENGNQALMDVDTSACVKNAMRMRPDRIVVGEIRDGAIVDLLSAASTGHDGTLSTGHANSPENFCNVRLPILYSYNKETDIKETSQMLQFAEAFELIIQLTRFPDGSRKVVSIAEITGNDENGRVKLSHIFSYNSEKKTFEFTGHIPKRIISKASVSGVKINEEFFTTGTDELLN